MRGEQRELRIVFPVVLLHPRFDKAFSASQKTSGKTQGCLLRPGRAYEQTSLPAEDRQFVSVHAPSSSAKNMPASMLETLVAQRGATGVLFPPLNFAQVLPGPSLRLLSLFG